MKTFKQFKEEAVAVAGAPGASSVSGGGIAGINPGEVPPVGKGITTAGHMLRRVKPHDTFGGRPVFKVNSNSYNKSLQGKKKYKHFKSYINGNVGEDIALYAKQNRNSPIIVQDEITGAMSILRHGKK